MNSAECLFCKIARGEIPSKKIYEDSDIIAFLDINPANKGHTLVVPKKHSETIFDTDDHLLGKAMSVAKQIATQAKTKLNADGVNIIQNNGQAAGQIVNHFHLHVMPRFIGDKVLITYQRVQLHETELDAVVKLLKSDAKTERKTSDYPSFDF